VGSITAKSSFALLRRLRFHCRLSLLKSEMARIHCAVSERGSIAAIRSPQNFMGLTARIGHQAIAYGVNPADALRVVSQYPEATSTLGPAPAGYKVPEICV
jgi:hypothetical protein